MKETQACALGLAVTIGAFLVAVCLKDWLFACVFSFFAGTFLVEGIHALERAEPPK